MAASITSKPLTSQNTTSSDVLCWKDRTPEINDRINDAFQKMEGYTKSAWGLFNGSSRYNLGNIKEHKLMRKVIFEALPEIKDFYALDIGAGNFQWGRELAKYLNKKADIPNDVTIHIIGIRAETNLDQAVTELGRCKLYEFGQFQVERLMDEFQKRGLHLTNRVDLVVSSWCFRHLADPVGTFAQTYDLLRPKTGYLLIDGFYFLYGNESLEGAQYGLFNFRMIRLCIETGAPFLTREYSSTRSLDHFIVRKPDDQPCHLYKQYLGSAYAPDGWQIGSHAVTRFKKQKKNDTKVSPLLYEGEYSGDKDMYEWLRQNGLLDSSHSLWGPLQEKDARKRTPPLHKAIACGDEEAIYRCLEEGCDINESDTRGVTPLHLSIKHKNYKLFLHLLEKGALKKLFAKWRTPLQLAMKYDFDGCFITGLIEAGADVNFPPNGYGRSSITPLSCAIKYKNVKAVELLLKAKAFVSYQNRQSLEGDSTFSSIQHLLPKKLSELEGFGALLNHIQNGDCVFFRYPGDYVGRKFQKSSQLEEDVKYIRVNVNPETRLLNDDNFQEIEDMSDCKSGDAFNDKAPHLELQFGF